MEIPPVPADDGIASAEGETAMWDWENLLEDFSTADDGSLILPWGTFDEVGTSPLELPPLPVASSPSVVPSPAVDSVGRVRKRDPSLICPNYLAGRVPCSCPELDKKAVEAEEVVSGARKRARSGTASAGVVRCQVPGCEADISELKGYHKRHRVCLRCANASSVVLNGEQKRYCQQCGKFHVLTNFDEGKRSCRRKLEWHNKRRQRKNNYPNNIVEEEAEAQGDPLLDVTCDDELLRDRSSALGCNTAETALSNKTMDRDAVDSADGQGSPIGSLPSLKNNELASSVEAQKDEKTALSKCSPSITLADEKNTYSSVCPTGRISFKLYDWNPAEFPRRLRHQIFQWLASMPVELEGYIRPGCTILTLFIAMPNAMWEKITQEADRCVRDLINQPGSLLLGRGNFLIYLSNTIIHVLQDGATLTNIKMEVQAPRLHYVYPAYLEAGKPLEFVACGSNLWQPKFRFLLSFCGKYLKHEVQRITCSEHEMFRTKVTHTDLEVFGPAFVEVENMSGLSNFIPVLVGSKDICSELKRIEEGFTGSCYDGNFEFHADSSVSCKVLMSRQYCMSTFLLDIAWVLKTPRPEDNEHFWSLINVERITTLLNFLLPNKYLSILQVIVCRLDDIILIKGFDKPESWTSNADLKRFHEFLNRAKEILSQEKLYDFRSAVESRNSVSGSLMLQSKISNIGDNYCANQDAETIRESSSSDSLQPNVENDGNVPLVTEDIIDGQRCYQNSFVDIFSNKTTRSQFPLFIAASVILCLIVCTIVLHPREAREFAVSIRRCKLGNTA